MKIYIHNANDYVETFLCQKLHKFHVLYGSLVENDAETPKLQQQSNVYLKHVVEHTKEAIQKALLECDCIIYNANSLRNNLSDIKDAIRILQGSVYTQEKSFIMISSAMSWALTKKQYEEVEEDEEGEEKEQDTKPRPYEALTEEVAPRRKAHPHFQELLEVEKRVKKSQNKLLKPLVVFAGLLYGEGERVLHPWFRNAWEGDATLPVLGDGHNYIPMIHVRDLASIVERMAVSPPEIDEEDKSSAYLFAVDESQTTQNALVGAIVKEFGVEGGVEHLSGADADQVPHQALLTVDLKFALGKVEAFEELEWHCKEGFVAKIKTVRREFEKARNLDALRVTVLGPPGVGKSFFSKKLAQYYKVSHITIKEAIEEFFEQTTALQAEVDRLTPPPKEKKAVQEEDGEDAPPEEEEEAEEVDEASPLQRAKRNLKRITDLQAKVDDDGRYTDDVLAKVFKWKLTQRECRNKGWIMDGFPKTVKQCQLLMKRGGAPAEGEEGEEGAEEEPEEEDDETQAGRADPLCMPEYIIQLSMDDALLEKRLMSLPQEQVEGTHNNRDDFTRRLKFYKEHNKYDDTGVLAQLEELVRAGDEVQPITREITIASLEQDSHVAMDEIIAFIGTPHNYGVTQMEIDAELQKQREIEREAQERARAEQEALAEKVARERAERARQLKEEQEQLEAIKKQEQDLLDVRSIPLRNYLMENVLPVLTEGLKEVCRMKPDDPVDYLAEYLFTNNSQNLTGQR